MEVDVAEELGATDGLFKSESKTPDAIIGFDLKREEADCTATKKRVKMHTAG